MVTAVLVVDDSRSSRRVNLAMLRSLLGEGVEYLEASSGEDALALLAKRAVDVVLLDLTMPGLSGFDVLAAMRERRNTARVIVVSADIQRLARERVETLGAVGFIAKPIHMEALRGVFTGLGAVHG